MIQYKGSKYKAAAAAAKIEDQYWRDKSLLFWIYAVVETKTGSDLPARAKPLMAKTWAKMPKEIRSGVGDDVDVQQRIMDCIGRGMCHYIVISGAGWEPGVRKGAAEVSVVQDTLEWINQFREAPHVRGSSLLWAEISSQVK